MAKTSQPEKKTTYQFPSRFGSHASMVIGEEGDFVVCKDEYGEYRTEKTRLDNGSADPNRWCLTKRGIKDV